MQIGGVKKDDLSFLQHAVSLEYLRIIGGTFTTARGIENCKKLNTLFLQKCLALTELGQTLLSLKNLEQVNLEGCRKVDAQQELEGLNIKYLSVI